MSGGALRATLLTARAAGGVAVVELSGPERFTAAARLLGDGVAVDATPRLRWLWHAGERIDQALVFTPPGRDTIELHLHGAETVLRAIERALGPLLRAAPGGRAALLAQASTAAQLEFALEQQALLSPFGGSFARFIAAHRGAPDVLRAVARRHAAAHALLTPCTVVLCGRKNAGKSTLMNRLLGRERVLVGPVPGSTRDPVAEHVTLAGYPYELVDTAGEGSAVDALDARAIDLGRRARARALVVLVVDRSAGVGPVERALLAVPPALVVATKSDLPAAPWPADVAPAALDVSCIDPAASAAVREAFGAQLACVRGLPPAGGLGGVAAVDDEELRLVEQALAG